MKPVFSRKDSLDDFLGVLFPQQKGELCLEHFEVLNTSRYSATGGLACKHYYFLPKPREDGVAKLRRDMSVVDEDLKTSSDMWRS